MEWFLVKIVFRIICGDGAHTAQFDEQLRLVEAANPNMAFVKATEIGMREEESFLNHNGQRVYWTFVNVSEVKHLPELQDGAELYSRILETDKPNLYLHNIHSRASHLQKRYTYSLENIL